jgi:hypothetical protein
MSIPKIRIKFKPIALAAWSTWFYSGETETRPLRSNPAVVIIF